MEPCRDSGRGRTQKGYCIIWVGNKCWYEHRYVYYKTHDNYEFKPGEQVRHTCDNRWCSEPTHLLLGRAKDNTGDMLRRGRQDSKLSDDQVYEIRRLIVSGDKTYQEIADLFNITKKTVSDISLGKSWRHLK